MQLEKDQHWIMLVSNPRSSELEDRQMLLAFMGVMCLYKLTWNVHSERTGFDRLLCVHIHLYSLL